VLVTIWYERYLFLMVLNWSMSPSSETAALPRLRWPQSSESAPIDGQATFSRLANGCASAFASSGQAAAWVLGCCVPNPDPRVAI